MMYTGTHDNESVGSKNDFVCENQKPQRHLHDCNSFSSLLIILSQVYHIIQYSIQTDSSARVAYSINYNVINDNNLYLFYAKL